MESSSSLSLPSSDLAGDKNEYEVFLSFRGADIRQGFVAHLYRRLIDAGIRVFRDSCDLVVGEQIVPSLMEAIKQSKVSIPIISSDYASSKFCLMELVQILECRKTMSREIIPIFYEIEPSDVRHQRNSFEESFREHKRRGVDSETMEKWKQALEEIAMITGFETLKIHYDGHLSKLIDELFPIVWQKLRKGRLIVTEKLVGVDHHVQEIMRKLGVVHRDGRIIEICGSDVRVLGIYGLGGVGKTTLAKVVYNQLYDRFQCYSYLKEFRELCENDGILFLQNQLISDLRKRSISFRSSHDATLYLAEQFRNKQVLILLDDVKDVDQFNVVVGDLSWFGPGSRIIVTSTRRDILSKFKEAETHEVLPMEEAKALELFYKQAFGSDSPPSKDFESLSREIISAIGRLPLAIEVTGSSLFGKPMELWREMLNKLKEASHEKVEPVLSYEKPEYLLKISYDVLDENAKQIFRTIACFSIGKDEKGVFYTWKECKLHTSGEIEVLLVNGFVKIGENNELLVHGQLKTLGRKIMESMSNKDPIPRNQSGLGVHKEAASTPWKEKKCEELEFLNSPFESLGTSVATIEHIVGIDDRVKDVIKLLEIEDDEIEVRIVVIHGTSGIGKTTIAKAVYDRLSSCFDSCSFLSEIGETTQNDGGIQCVQTKLIRDILERDGDVASFEEGIKFFLDVFSNIKALIVLDDVEKQSHLDDLVGNQLDWFGPGSRIIVTSEDGEILNTFVSRGRVRNYEVNQMDNDRALELFRKHALGAQGSTPDYLEIEEDIMKATGEVPLVIEVIGSFLRGKTIEECRKMGNLIKRQTENSREVFKDCREILKFCYDKVDDDQREIFWDIAQFANGMDSRIALYMWPDRDLSHSHHVLMPLAKIGGDNMLRMHKQLKCLCRTIDPVKYRIRYMHDTDLKEEEVEALCFDLKSFTETNFKSMPNIRFLKLDHASMTGNFANVFPKLRWLHWQGCPRDFEATELNLTKLVILDLSWSKVTEDWGGWRKIKMEQLKVLNLTGCADLLISPKFSSFPNLEMLILERCSQLVHLDPSVGDLEKLLCLNLRFCTELNRLPAELGKLKALKELLIDETSVRDIPLGGDSKKLETLSASNCLSLSLPDGVGELVKLRRLSFRNCQWIQKLPESIGQLGSLEELDISGTGICELPDSFGNLQRLRVLKMDYCFISKFPSFIWDLRSLEEIHASSCRNLEGEIPGDIGKLINLRILRLQDTAISSLLPPEIKRLPKLETLDPLHCDMLPK